MLGHHDINSIKQIAKRIRISILESTTTAGSGHPSSSLSATDIMTVLMFGGYFKANINDSHHADNDRLIFSKGHAAPLLYSLYHHLGAVSREELLSLRRFGSNLEGHPTMNWVYTESPTGSLGQGIGIACGIALAGLMEKRSYRTFVLLGDSEMMEGSVWESLAFAAHYKLGNLVGIIDVNRLGQRGETIHGHDIETYREKCEAFGWESYSIDGHDYQEIVEIFNNVLDSRGDTNKPVMIISKTIKGKGVSFMEDKLDWHGKALKPDELALALEELSSQ